MNNVFHNFERLAARARMENVPSVDVSRRVLSRLSHVPQASTWPLSLLAAAAAAAAVLAVSLSLPSYETLTHPLNAIFITAINILP